MIENIGHGFVYPADDGWHFSVLVDGKEIRPPHCKTYSEIEAWEAMVAFVARQRAG